MKTRILLLVLAAAGHAPAATLTQIRNFSFIPDDSAVLSYDRFDPALGTLTGITVTTRVTKTGGSLFVDNESALPAIGTITHSVVINLKSVEVDLLASTGGFIGSHVEAQSTYAAHCEADDSDDPLLVEITGLDYDGSSFEEVTTTETKSVKSLVWSEFVGAGGYTITALGSQGYNTTAVGGATTMIEASRVAGDVTVTYDFTPVPEPTTALLGGCGLLSLLVRRRR